MESVILVALSAAKELVSLIREIREATAVPHGKVEAERAARLALAEWMQVVSSRAGIDASGMAPDLEAAALSLHREHVPQLRDLRPRVRDLPSLSTRHSVVVADGGRISLHLGTSSEAKALSGRTRYLDLTYSPPSIPVPSMAPKMNITVLGHSGVGKTSFLAAMYTQLATGIGGLALRCQDTKTDGWLRAHMDRLLLDQQWPAGTQDDVHEFHFDLLLESSVIADVNVADYRGGLLNEADRDENLRARLRESQIVIWLIDLGKVKGRLTSAKARAETGVGRIAALCREEHHGRPRSWVFVRTKCDADAPRPVTNRVDAAKELLAHMGDAANVPTLGSYASAAVIPVSVLGENAEDPVNVEWPILLGVAGLLSGYDRYYAGEVAHHQGEQPGSTWIRRVFGLGPSDAQVEWLSRAEALARELTTTRHALRKLCAGVPAEIIAL